LHNSRVAAIPIMIVLMFGSATLQNVEASSSKSSAFYPYDSGIVYLQPSDASTPFWMRAYGDRTAFYVYSNISVHRSGILRDLSVISRYYRFIVRIVPLDDTDYFYYNLRLMDSWAAETSLKILYAFFPKSKYGPERSYLTVGTEVYARLVYDMWFVRNLSSTAAIAVWYGWEKAPMDLQAIQSFYDSLPQELKALYCVWLDGSYVRKAVRADLPRLVDPLNITVVTELYSTDILAQFGFAFKRQIIVSGFSGAYSVGQWRVAMAQKLSYVHASDGLHGFDLRKLAIWTFWDRNDGSGEQYTAYLSGALSNPLFTSIPQLVLLDQTRPISMRVNVGSIVPLTYHFSWPEGLNAADIEVNVNGTDYHTDADGWVHFTKSYNRVAKLTLVPTIATWGPYPLKVVPCVEIPAIIFDRVLIRLFAYPNPVQVGANATISAKGIYEYDGAPFQGIIFLNDTEFNKPSSGTYHYLVTRIDDRLHGLTAFDSNTLTVTFYERPTRVTSRTYLTELLSALFVAIVGSLVVWITWKRKVKKSSS